LRLSHCTHDTVLHVAMNMRERDKEEIYNVRAEPNPFLLMNDVMAQASFSWVAWAGERPCAVFGGAPIHPGVWSMFMFGTDEMTRRIVAEMSRFALDHVVPTLFEKLGAHRLQCDSHWRHEEAHRWLKRLGARRESIREGFGKDGSDYFHYVLSKDIDGQTRQV